jgi:uncharacterized membrane protein (UPF0127 family)
MRLVHESAEGRRTLATDVEVADSLLAKTRGLMFREEVPEGYALVFRFEPTALERAGARLPGPLAGLGEWAGSRGIHMLFVRVPLDVLWLRDGEVVRVRTLNPWRGMDSAAADTVVELPGGAAEGVEPGDTVRLVEDAGRTDADPEASADDTSGVPADDDTDAAPGRESAPDPAGSGATDGGGDRGE